MAHEPVSREDVPGALERTLARGAARFEYRYELDFDFDWPASQSPPVRVGPLVRHLMRRRSGQALNALLRAMRDLLMRWAGQLAASATLRVSKRWSGKLSAQRAVGVIDFDAHRCMYGYPGRSEVMLVVGDRYWQGAPGTAVDALSEKPGSSAIQPLWVLDLVRGVEEAHASGEEVLDGHTCRRLSAHADLNRVADAVPYQIALPPGIEQLGQLTQLPVELWVDRDGQIRRIRHSSGERPGAPMNTSTVELRELGVEPPSDWSRLEIPVA